MHQPYYFQRGFHFVEVLVSIAIISITAALSFPLYSQYVVHARRLEAASILSKLAIAMEQFHIEHNTYQNATLIALNFPEKIAKNNYQLIIQAATHSEYLLIAKPLGSQSEKDMACAALTLSSNGEKGITGSGNTMECW
ncbi:MAG: prepilin-type N-terminal cleavage/methylation domain-containing protein [Gammaproteobacteria bacterium]|nr:prepilin-type N-terminal cleavage/methylation domain-containing protein [Gammaproteobacteria bacterium]MCW5582306.1 prepilin-type N-terminal cleavage/methylation domain-containing protein [Gammaproteobacteria bacterium]